MPDRKIPPGCRALPQSRNMYAQDGAWRAGVDAVQRGVQFIIAFWHQVILEMQLRDYSRRGPDGNEADPDVLPPENPGPCYASRAMAIAHLAMYDAYVGVTGDGMTYQTFAPSQLPPPVPGVRSNNC